MTDTVCDMASVDALCSRGDLRINEELSTVESSMTAGPPKYNLQKS